MIPRREQFSSIPSKLPVAPRPAAGEVRSSWLLRIAIANGLSLIELLGALDCRHARELGPLGCIDGALPPAWATALAAFCHVSVPWVNALQFSHQFPYWPKEWLLRWLPMDFRHADRTLSLRARYAFCTRCLGEMDRFRGFVWIRSEWTCALITHCARHRLRLYERCPECFVVDPLSIGPSSLPGRANACRRCDSLLVFKNVPGLKDLTEQVLSLQQRLLDLCTSTEMFGDTPRKRFGGDRWEHDVAELLQPIDGTPVFLLMADSDPRCDILLRGRTIPEAKLCYFAWHWRLLLAYALAEIQAIPPVLGGTGNRESFQEFTAASFQAMNTTPS